MSLFDEQNSDNQNDTLYEWVNFLKAVGVCSILSLVIAALSMPTQTMGNIITMAVYVVFLGFVIMIIPILIGLVSGFLKKSKCFAFLFSWFLISGLFILGLIA